jgi:hypothetical protein
VHQPRIGPAQIGGTHRGDSLHRATLAGEPALFGKHRRQRVGDIDEQIDWTDHG